MKATMWLNDYPISWREVPKCASCHLTHRLRCKKTNEPARRALILVCSHTVCEVCAHSNRTNRIKCTICGVFTMLDPKVSLHLQLQQNFYLSGLTNFLDYDLKERMGRLIPKANTVKPLAAARPLFLCSECGCSGIPDVCQQCDVPYCRGCFNKLHSQGKVFRLHRLIPFVAKTMISTCLASAQQQQLPLLCSVHVDDELSNYCIDCKLPICGQCKSEYHAGHDISTLVLENRKTLPKLRAFGGKIQVIRDSIGSSEQETLSAIAILEHQVSAVIEKISSHFIIGHTILQQMEDKALKSLKARGAQMLLQTNNVRSQLQSSLDQLQETESRLLSITADKTPFNMNLPKLVDEIDSFLDNIPCHVQIDEAKKTPFRFKRFPNTDDIEIPGVPDQLTLFLTSSGGQQCPIEMQTTNTITAPSFSSSSSSSTASFLRADAQFSSGSSVNRPISKASMNNSIQSALHNSSHRFASTDFRTQFATGDARRRTTKVIETNNVHITHIVNPQRFYVQNEAFANMADVFNANCTKESLRASKPDSIALNTMYLVHVSLASQPNNSRWQRAIVSKCLGNNTYKVFYIDFGNHEDVKEHRFRTLSDKLVSRPPGVIECSICCVVPNATEWSDEAVQLMIEMTANNTLQMLTVHTNDDGVQLVDIFAAIPSSRTSVRDALLFLGYANETISPEMEGPVQRYHHNKEKLQKNDNRQQFHPHSLKKRDMLEVQVVEITSPHLFYVMKTGHSTALDKLTADMNAFYESSVQFVYAPASNMICAARLADVWYRARVVRLLPDAMCELWLVDKATLTVLSWRHLRYLDHRFAMIAESVALCKLSDIEPVDNETEWSEAAIVEFKRIAQCSSIFVSVNAKMLRTYSVNMYIIRRSSEFNVNAMLVRQKLANATGSGDMRVEQNNDGDVVVLNSTVDDVVAHQRKKTKDPRKAIEVLNVISPGEFYITLVAYVAGIEQMHFQIQNYMNVDQNDDGVVSEKATPPSPTAPQWKVGDHCLVRTTAADVSSNAKRCWYRGKVLMVNGVDDFVVFLRDRGSTVNALASDMAVIASRFDLVGDGAFRCHLACVRPTGNQKKWSQSAIAEFQAHCAQYDALGVSWQGERQNDSISVVLWGMSKRCEDPLSSHTCEWYNINNLLVIAGFLHQTDRFKPIGTVAATSITFGLDGLDVWLDKMTIETNQSKGASECYQPPAMDVNNLDDSKGNYKLLYQDSIADDGGECIESWPAAIPIVKHAFVGIPTFVDNNAVIYLHDFYENGVMERIKQLINDKYRGSQMDASKVWHANEVCVAEYHLDRCFYRAIILRVLANDRFKVQFVDYGNVETCSASELRAPSILSRVPILARKFCLQQMFPTTGNGVWPLKALDFLHAQIVDKACYVSSEDAIGDNAVQPCVMKLGSDSIAELMICNGMARYRQNVAASQVDICLNPFEDDDEQKPNVKSTVLVDFKAYQKMFAKQKFDSRDLFHNSDSDNDDDQAEETVKPLNFTFDQNHFDDEVIVDDVIIAQNASDSYDNVTSTTLSTISNFQPNATSSNKNFAVAQPPPRLSDVQSISKFKTLQLDRNVPEFRAKAMLITNALRIWICPQTDVHMQRLQQMTKQIQRYVSQQKAQPNSSVIVGMPCLVRFKDDNLFYRAKVRSYDAVVDEATVMFVDYLNCEIVPSEDVLKCPPEIQQLPLGVVEVRLHGLRVNPRMREFDVEQILGQLLHDCEFMVRVVKMAGRRVPEVDLLQPNDLHCLLYQSMVVERYYLQKKPTL